MSPIRRVRERGLPEFRFLLARCPHRAAPFFSRDQEFEFHHHRQVIRGVGGRHPGAPGNPR